MLEGAESKCYSACWAHPVLTVSWKRFPFYIKKEGGRWGIEWFVEKTGGWFISRMSGNRRYGQHEEATHNPASCSAPLQSLHLPGQ